MNLKKLDKKLRKLLSKDAINQAIALVEEKLSELPESKFQACIGRNMLQHGEWMSDLMASFHTYAKKDIEDKPAGFINSLFKKKEKTGKTLAAISWEMNELTANNDSWYFTVFAYDECGTLDDLDWLADYNLQLADDVAIIGFEDIQEACRDYIVNERSELEDHADLCERLVLLRLQELFREAHTIALSKSEAWASVPFFVYGGDGLEDVVYAVNVEAQAE